MPRKIFLVVCEGETEKTYVEALKQHYRIPVAIKTKVSGNQINARLVGEFVRELGLERGDDYNLFYIYDSDIECIVEKLKSLPGFTILSNPCIELWFILHTKSQTRSIETDDVVNALRKSHQAWTNYVKGIFSSSQLKLLLENKTEAIDRARSLNFPNNPSTNVHEFIAALESAKK